MRRCSWAIAILLAFLAGVPQPLKATTMRCMWWWTHSIIEYNTITGEYVETHYFKRVCPPEEPT